MILQNLVWWASIVVMAVVAGVFIWVADSASRHAEHANLLTAAAYRLRPWLFLILALVIVAANWRALLALPYPAFARVASQAGAVQRVDVLGEQWDWQIKPARVIAGRPVAFHVTAKDVNHDFAIYDGALNIVAQTQAMPGFDNVLHHTFTRPGTYQVMCLEYCGLMHHNMKAVIEVVAP